MRDSRRDFLKATGAMAALGVGAVTTGSGEPGESGPSEFTGQRIHRFKPNGDTYEHTERFVGQGLAAEYGVNAMEYERAELPREAVETALPEARKRPGTVVTKKRTDTAVIGTFRELREFERAQRNNASAASDVTIKAGDYYSGPIYHYNSDKDYPTLDDLGEPKAPINVGWEDWVEPDAKAVSERMYNDFGWGGWLEDPIFKKTRYIIVDTGSYSYVKGNDTDVTEEITLSKQWHCRLYTLDDEEPDYSVVGQAHKDPYLHDGPPWDFVQARRRTVKDWDEAYYPVGTQDLYNGWRWDTSDGYMSQVG